MIAGDPRIYGRVYVGTNGRGIFYGDVSSTPAADFTLTATPSSLTVRRGASGTVTIGITRTGTLADPVALTVTGLPTGVAAAFSPASATGASSVLTLSVSSTAVGGTYPLTVTGTSGTLRRTAAVSLTVSTVTIDPPLVTITPSTLSVTRGASATATLTFARPTGYTGPISCSASGIPAGVTVAFNPVSTTATSSTLTFTASSAATVGTSLVTVTCTAGTVTGSAGVTLTVVDAAGFGLTAAPATLSVVRGASGTSTITITRTGGFTGTVTLSASGAPAGVSASFTPASVTGTSSVLTLTVSGTTTPGTYPVTVTGTSGTLSRMALVTLSIPQDDLPSFTFTITPGSSSLPRGGSVTATLSFVRINFTSPIACTAVGLPSGVTAAFSPTSTTANSSVVTFSASTAATLGAANVAIACSGNNVTRSVPVALTVVEAPGFTLSASPATLNVAQASSGTSTVTITRTGGFTGAVSFSASGLPAGVTATFAPASTTGASTVATFAASSTAAAGTTNVTITGTSGTLVGNVTVALTVTPGSTAGVVTATPVVSANSPWYNELQVKLDNTATLTAATVTITVAVTPGVNPTGQYNTVGGQFAQTRTSTATAITYTWQLAAGQTLPAGTGRLFAAQFGGNGTAHPTAGDLYTVTYTSGGVTSTVNGHF